MSSSKAYHSLWYSVYISNRKGSGRISGITNWSVTKGGNREVGSRNEVIWETVGRSREETKSSCCQILLGCRVNGGAGSLSQALLFTHEEIEAYREVSILQGEPTELV